MSLGTNLYTWLYGNMVGQDDENNKYYCNSKISRIVMQRDGLFLVVK